MGDLKKSYEYLFPVSRTSCISQSAKGHAVRKKHMYALMNIFCRSSPTWKALKQWEIDVHESDNDNDWL